MNPVQRVRIPGSGVLSPREAMRVAGRAVTRARPGTPEESQPQTSILEKAGKYRSMTTTTRQDSGTGHPGRAFLIPSGIQRYHRCLLTLWLLLGLAACGGSSNSASPAPGPAAEDLGNARAASPTATLDLSTNRATLKWTDTFPRATRYEVEQQNDDGTWSVIDGVWATQGSQLPLQWTGSMSAAETLRVEAVMPGYTVPLETPLSQTSIAVAPPAVLPDIEFDQPEPVESQVTASIANAATYFAVTYIVDGVGEFDSTETNAPYAAPVPVSNLTTGAHVVVATLQVDSVLTLQISRGFQVHTSGAALSLNVAKGPSVVDIDVVATSDSGITSVTASVDDTVSLGSLAAPNACTPAPCSSGQPFNAYHFSFEVAPLGTGSHGIETRAVDGAGNTAVESAEITFPSPTEATLDSPLDGTSVQGTFAISGTFASGTPGALELMVALSGMPVYDTSLANPGSVVPFSTEINLSGVTNGPHTIDVYARVGSANYQLMTSAIVVVTGAP